MDYNVSDLKYYKEKYDAIAKANGRNPTDYIYEDEVKLSEKEKLYQSCLIKIWYH